MADNNQNQSNQTGGSKGSQEQKPSGGQQSGQSGQRSGTSEQPSEAGRQSHKND